jgi:hypothetical protein
MSRSRSLRAVRSTSDRPAVCQPIDTPQIHHRRRARVGTNGLHVNRPDAKEGGVRWEPHRLCGCRHRTEAAVVSTRPVVALAILAATLLATYLAVRFAGQGAAPDIEGATGSRSEHREDAKVT